MKWVTLSATEEGRWRATGRGSGTSEAGIQGDGGTAILTGIDVGNAVSVPFTGFAATNI